MTSTSQRFLGETEDGYGDALGISNSFAADIIMQPSVTTQKFTNVIYGPIGIVREGSLNALWTEGGLLYSPAWR